MRWLVAVTSLGKTEKDSLYVDADSWQKALQVARTLRGETEPMSGFSIELFDEGCRAVDPATRIRYEVSRAAEDARPPRASTAPPRAAATADAAAVQPAAEPSPPTGVHPPVGESPPRARSQFPPRPQISATATMMLGSPPPVASVAASGAPFESARPEPESRIPRPYAEHRSAAPPPSRGDSIAPLPSQIVFKREQDPTEALPLTYREYVYVVPQGSTEMAAATLVQGQLEFVRASLDRMPAGKLVNLAVFDATFQGKPPVPPLATLAWKDWRGVALVSFPRQPGRSPVTIPTGLPPAVLAPASTIAPAPSIAPAPVIGPVSAPAFVSLDPATAFAPAKVFAPTQAPPSIHVPPTPASPSVRAPTPPNVLASTPAPENIFAPAPAGVFAPGAAPANPFAPTPAPPNVFAPGAAPENIFVPAPDFAPTPTFAPTPAFAPTPTFTPTPTFAPTPVFAPTPAPAPDFAPTAAPAREFAAAPVFAPPQPVATVPGFTETPAPPYGRPLTSPVAPPVGAVGRIHGEDLIADLFESMHDLHFARDAVDGGDFCLALAMTKLPSRAGIVQLYDINRREFLVTNTRGEGTSALLLRRFPESDGLLAAAMRKRSAVVIADAMQSEATTNERYVVIGGARSLIVAPVMLAGRFLGAIELLNPIDGQPFTESDGNAVTYIAEQFAEFVASRGIVTDPERISVRPPH